MTGRNVVDFTKADFELVQVLKRDAQDILSALRLMEECGPSCQDRIQIVEEMLNMLVMVEKNFMTPIPVE